MATIRPRGGKWQAQIRRKGHEPISKTFTKKILAQRWATKKESEIDEGSYRDLTAASKTLLSALFDKYGDIVTPTKDESSHAPEKTRLRTLKKSALGKLHLAELAVGHILGYVDERLKTVGPDAIRKELQLLCDVVDSAQLLWGLHIIANPVPAAKRALSKLRKLKPGNKRKRRLYPGEYEGIRDCPHQKFTLINKISMLDIETGLRRSELARARREYIDKSKRIMHVPKSKTDWMTGSKGRVIPLSPLALEIIDSLPARLDGSLFGMKPKSITRAFERTIGIAREAYEKKCVEAGIAPDLKMFIDLRLHDLRHEAISRWFEIRKPDGSKMFSIEEIASMSGHEDWASLKRYTHPDPEKLAQMLSA